MNYAPLTVVDVKQQTDAISTPYANFSVATVNDHVIKASVMTEDFYWHYHPNSDETFLVIAGGLLMDLENETIELYAGQMFAIPANVIHRTRPKDGRSVNITFEHSEIETVKVEV